MFRRLPNQLPMVFPRGSLLLAAPLWAVLVCVAGAADPPVTTTGATRVTSLQIEACLAQWDADPQPDGLRVWVFPLDAGGKIVPVHGQLDLTLVGTTQPIAGAAWQKTPRFPELERKSQLVRHSDFLAGPAVYQVPFSRAQPDYDLQLAWPGLLHARLRVPSVGAFDASAAGLELREFSPFRDTLWQHTGRRYLPLEDAGRTGR